MLGYVRVSNLLIYVCLCVSCVLKLLEVRVMSG
jgi:hypothetical protein